MLLVLLHLLFLPAHAGCEIPPPRPVNHEGKQAAEHPVACDAKNGADPCQDLYAAACLDKDHEPLTRKLDTKVGEFVDDALQTALKATGGNSLEKAYFDFCKEQGHPVRDDLDEERRKALVRGPAVEKLPETFASIPECSSRIELSDEDKKKLDKAADDFSKASVLPDTDPNRAKGMQQAQKVADDIVEPLLKGAAEKRREFLAKARAKYEKNYTSFVGDYLDLCRNLPDQIKKRAADVAKHEKDKAAGKGVTEYGEEVTNVSLKEVTLPASCGRAKLYEVRNSAVELFRISDEKERAEAAKKVLETFYPAFQELHDLDSRLGSEPSFRYQSKSKYPFLNKRGDELDRAGDARSAACHRYSALATREVVGLHSKFFGKLARSRPSVEKLLELAYSEGKRKAIDGSYNRVHGYVMHFVQNELAALPMMRDSEKLKKIEESMKGLKYYWPKPLEDALFHKEDGFPLPVLNLEKVPEGDPVLSGFADPSLGYFKELNAFYHPTLNIGEVKVDEKVNFMPTINLLAERDPFAAMSIMAHEIGHKIGYLTSRTNGYDLTKEYEALVKCLSSKQSIGLRKNQIDEAIADWISAKVMGRILAGTNDGERRDAALRTVGFFCEAEAKRLLNEKPDLEEDHPDSVLRVNGIYGANSEIRKALGCEGKDAKGKYRECSLKGAVE